MSSHPDADPQDIRPLVTESDVRDYEREKRRPKPIISINGEDVDQDELRTRRAA